MTQYCSAEDTIFGWEHEPLIRMISIVYFSNKNLSTERGPARLDLFTVLALGVSKV